MEKKCFATKITTVVAMVVQGCMLNDLALKRTVKCEEMATVFLVVVIGASLIGSLVFLFKKNWRGALSVFVPSLINAFMWTTYFYRLDIGLLMLLMFLSVIIDLGFSKIIFSEKPFTKIKKHLKASKIND